MERLRRTELVRVVNALDRLLSVDAIIERQGGWRWLAGGGDFDSDQY